MNLETINSLAQILAVVLVVPSLIYLALQVRQNTRQLRAAARYQFVYLLWERHPCRESGSEVAISVIATGTLLPPVLQAIGASS